MDTNILRLASWNVDTVNDVKRRNIIFKELFDQNIDIACLQETKLSTYKFEGQNHTIVSNCSNPKSIPHGGVGFAFKNELMGINFTCNTCDPKRLSMTQIDSNNEIIHIINVYAPTEPVKEEEHKEEKDSFYDSLDNEFSKIPPSDKVFIIGDFNAQVGADNVAWPTCIGAYGVGTTNDNGQRLLEFCSLHNLCILNTYSDVPESERFSRKHPGNDSWRQLDLCITRERDRNIIISTRSAAELREGFNHKMVILEINMQLPVQRFELCMFRFLLYNSIHFTLNNDKWSGDVNNTTEWVKSNILKSSQSHLINNYLELVEISIATIKSLFPNRQIELINEHDTRKITESIHGILLLFLDNKTNIKKYSFDTFDKEVTKLLKDMKNKSRIIFHFFKGNQRFSFIDFFKYAHLKQLIELETITRRCYNGISFSEELRLEKPISETSSILESTRFHSRRMSILEQLQQINIDDKLQKRNIFKCRSEKEMLFTLNLLQEKCLNKNVPLFIAFVDLSQIMKEETNSTASCWNKGPQWALYAPFLLSKAGQNDIEMQNYALYLSEYILSYILQNSLDEKEAILTLKYKLKRNLFNSSKLDAKSTFHLRGIQYKDCAAIFATSIIGIQKYLGNFENICNDLGLSFIKNKPKVLSQNVEDILSEIPIALKNVPISKNLIFLGVNFTGDRFSIETEIFTRIHNTCKKMRTIATLDPNVFTEVCRPNLLCNLEVLSLTKELKANLDNFDERCYRRLKIQINTYISDEIFCQQMILFRNYYIESEDSVTKRIFYGDVVQERHTASYISNLKQDLKRLQIDVAKWESHASTEETWISFLKEKINKWWRGSTLGLSTEGQCQAIPGTLANQGTSTIYPPMQPFILPTQDQCQAMPGMLAIQGTPTLYPFVLPTQGQCQAISDPLVNQGMPP